MDAKDPYPQFPSDCDPALSVDQTIAAASAIRSVCNVKYALMTMWDVQHPGQWVLLVNPSQLLRCSKEIHQMSEIFRRWWCEARFRAHFSTSESRKLPNSPKKVGASFWNIFLRCRHCVFLLQLWIGKSWRPRCSWDWRKKCEGTSSSGQGLLCHSNLSALICCTTC